MSLHGGLHNGQGRPGNCQGEPNGGLERNSRRVGTHPMAIDITATPGTTQRRLP
jgi:hypothetical protein